MDSFDPNTTELDDEGWHKLLSGTGAGDPEANPSHLNPLALDLFMEFDHLFDFNPLDDIPGSQMAS